MGWDQQDAQCGIVREHDGNGGIVRKAQIWWHKLNPAGGGREGACIDLQPATYEAVRVAPDRSTFEADLQVMEPATYAWWLQQPPVPQMLVIASLPDAPPW